MSQATKKLKKKYIFFDIMSVILLLTPMLTYICIAFIEGGFYQKFTLGLTVTISFLFVLVNIIFKHKIRSTIWILLIGISNCLTNINLLLLIVAISTIVDEFILEPLSKKYKGKYIINNEIDKRSE